MQGCGVPFEGGLTTLYSVIKSMGFKWRNTADKRKVLMETQGIRYQRNLYLWQLKKYKEEGWPIIYTDESYIHSSHTTPYEWSDNSLCGLKKPIEKGPRLNSPCYWCKRFYTKCVAHVSIKSEVG